MPDTLASVKISSVQKRATANLVRAGAERAAGRVAAAATAAVRGSIGDARAREARALLRCLVAAIDRIAAADPAVAAAPRRRRRRPASGPPPPRRRRRSRRRSRARRSRSVPPAR